MEQTSYLFLGVLGVCALSTMALACVGIDGESTSSDDGCGISLCGCSEDTTMAFSTTVQDSMTMMPLANIELLCFGEDAPMATSDQNGVVSFSIQTQSSPGCGFARCNNMKLHDPTGTHPDIQGTFFSWNDQTVSM